MKSFDELTPTIQEGDRMGLGSKQQGSGEMSVFIFREGGDGVMP